MHGNRMNNRVHVISLSRMVSLCEDVHSQAVSMASVVITTQFARIIGYRIHVSYLSCKSYYQDLYEIY